MLKKRQKSILNAVIQDYVDTAKPVASRDLVKKFRLGVSPATARNEMMALDELGYLEQPHTSAGRIPTDQGYRFFVDYLMEGFLLGQKEQKLIEAVFELKKEEEFVKELSRVISRVSGTFSATGLFKEEVFYESGLAGLLEEPEFQNIQEHPSLGYLFDSLEDNIRQLLDDEDWNGEEFLIGEENPMQYARTYTMAITTWSHPRGFSGFLTMLSPKRVNYPKQKAVLKSIRGFKYDG